MCKQCEPDLPERWTDAQRDHYWKVMRFMVSNQFGVSHPRASLVPTSHWETLSHNAAWCAAEFLECESLTICDNDTGQVVASTPAMIVN